MKRGFKSNSEKRSLALRKELGLKHYDPIDCVQLAEYLDLKVIPIDKLCKWGLSRERLNIFGNGAGYEEFSAVVLETPHGKLLIYNHFHSQNRINSSVAHEIAHVDCQHDFSTMPSGEGLGLIREFPKEFEDEANWFAGCLLIPRKGLEWAAKQGMNKKEIAVHFNTSEEMARWRYNKTGMALQMKRYAKYKPS